MDKIKENIKFEREMRVKQDTKSKEKVSTHLQQLV